jgi:hypothetical protein
MLKTSLENTLKLRGTKKESAKINLRESRALSPNAAVMADDIFSSSSPSSFRLGFALGFFVFCCSKGSLCCLQKKKKNKNKKEKASLRR